MKSHQVRPELVASLIVCGLALWACSSRDGNAPQSVVYYNAKIVTLDARSDIAQAVAITDGRFVAVGSDERVRELAPPGSRFVDLQGKTVVPGFYDNHVHLGPGSKLMAWQGGFLGAVDEWIRDVHTLDQLKEALRRRATSVPQGEWIRGALNRPDWPNQKIPTRWDLDEAGADHPVALSRGPHTLILNSAALQLAGITKETPDPPGGWIIRDERGEPSGRVLESARRLVTRVLPRSGPSTGYDEGLANMRQMLRQLESVGITSVNIAGVTPDGIRDVQDLYDRWGDELPRATMMVRLSPGTDTYDDPAIGVRNTIKELEALGFHTGFGNDRLKIGAIKMSVDGGLSAPVFWSIDSYEGRPGFHGTIRIPAEVFYPVAKRAHDLGWQIGIHAMGDGAVQMVVDQFDRILRESPRADHRHQLHHVAVKPPERTLRKMADLGLVVASQPNFTSTLGAFAVEALQGEREASQNPTKSLLDRGIRMSYGSDDVPNGPLFGIWVAVTRKGWEGKVYGPEEAVSVEEAIRLYTMGSAYMTFDETKKGSIEVGKLADLVVLGEDILSADPDRIKDIPVERTVIGGREVFAR